MFGILSSVVSGGLKTYLLDLTEIFTQGIMGNFCAKLRSLFRRNRSRPENNPVNVDVAEPLDNDVGNNGDVEDPDEDDTDWEDIGDEEVTEDDFIYPGDIGDTMYHLSSEDVSQMSEEDQVQVLDHLCTI